MTPKDGGSLSENEIDEIVERVVEQLGGSNDGAANAKAADNEADQYGETVVYDSDEPDDHREPDERPREGAEDHAERIENEVERIEERVERGSERFEQLGERIEAEVERSLDRVADTLERSLGGSAGAWPQPPRPPEPEPGRDRAVYKTQLQKGGRVAVPDAEIEALDLEPGDTLQVTLYEVD